MYVNQRIRRMGDMQTALRAGLGVLRHDLALRFLQEKRRPARQVAGRSAVALW